MGTSEHTTIPSGFRFEPTDEELVCPYVYNKNNGIPIPSNMVMECDVYGEGEPWREIFQHTGEKTHYFYTRSKKKTEKGLRVERGTGSCTWRSQKDNPIHIKDGRGTKHIGSVRSFTLVPKKGFKKNGRWVMHEYRLDGYLLNITKHNDFVLCRIQKKNELKATTTNQEQQKENNANIKINDAAPKAELNGNSNHTEPMQPMDMDTTERITQMEGQTCNNIVTAGIMIAHYGIVKDADKNMQALSTPPQNWQTQSKSSTKPRALNLAETPEHMGIKFPDRILISSSVAVPTSTLLGNNAYKIQGADSQLFWKQQPPLMEESSLVNDEDSIMELSSISSIEPSTLYLEETRVTTQRQMSVMSPKVFISATPLVPASTSPLPSGSNACRTVRVGTELVWDRQHPIVMGKNISSGQSYRDECGLINKADNNMELSPDSDLWTTMYQLEDIMSMPEPCANQMIFSTEKGSLNISDIGVKIQGQLGILPPELIWDNHLLSQVDENFWSSPYF